MRFTLATLAILNLLAALLVLGLGLSMYSTTSFHWSIRRQALLETGQLVEQPTTQPANRDLWLRHELLPSMEDWEQYRNILALFLGAQGAVLLVLAHRRTVSDST